MNNFGFSEAELRERFIDSVYENLRYRLFLEVPVFTRSVDLVIQRTDTKEITAIEFKLHDWKRAILQVQSVALCFDYLSICLPKPKTSVGEQKIVDTCKSNGIGLYFYDIQDNTFKTILNSPKVENVWKQQKERVICYLEEKR